MLHSLLIFADFHFINLDHELGYFFVLAITLDYQWLVLLAQLSKSIGHFLHVKPRLGFLVLADCLPRVLC